MWDLDRPLEKDCTLSLLKFDDDEAKAVFWHSSAHILGEACENYSGGHLCYGPPIADGFYYDMYKEVLLKIFNFLKMSLEFHFFSRRFSRIGKNDF